MKKDSFLDYLKNIHNTIGINVYLHNIKNAYGGNMKNHSRKQLDLFI